MAHTARTPLVAALLVLVCAAVILPRFDPSPKPGYDPLGYFCYLPALFDGRPFDLNEFAVSARPMFYREKIETPRTVDPWGVGPAIGWLPFYALSDVTHPDLPHTAPPFWRACAMGTVVFALAGILLLFCALAPRFGRFAAFAAALAALLCTPMLLYASREPLFGHVFAFMLVSILMWSVATRDLGQWHTWLVMGLACGLMADTRPQLVLCVILPLAVRWPRARHLGLFGLGMLLAFFPQMLMWRMTFGRWLVIPQATLNHEFFHTPAVWQVLFSPLHGLFPWHPLLLLGLVGLLLAALPVPGRRLALAAVAVFATQVVINGAGHDWWGGWSFGGRRFTDMVPLLMLGVANMVALSKAMILPVALTAWWNFGLLWAWRGVVHPVAPLTWDAVRQIARHLIGL